MRKRTGLLLTLLGIVGSCSTLEKTRFCFAQGAWYDDAAVIADAQAKIVQQGHFTGDLAAYARENPDCCRLTVKPRPHKLGFRQYKYDIAIPLEEPDAAGRRGRERYIEEGYTAYSITHYADRCLRYDTFGGKLTASMYENYWEYY